MDDLVKWLREQIAEDELAARKATLRTMADTDQWQADWSAGMQIRDGKGHLIVKHSWPNEIEHIVRHDPRSVLAQCEAHAMLLDSITARLGDADQLEQMGAQPADVCAIRAPAEWQLAVTSLAYQHRPGWQEAWRP